MTASTSSPTIRFTSTTGTYGLARKFGWTCTCGAFLRNARSSDFAVADADNHARIVHPHGSTVEYGGLS